MQYRWHCAKFNLLIEIYIKHVDREYFTKLTLTVFSH